MVVACDFSQVGRIKEHSDAAPAIARFNDIGKRRNCASLGPAYYLSFETGVAEEYDLAPKPEAAVV